MKTNCQKITDVIVVETVEPGIAFWNKLGFETITSVPLGDDIGFVILSNGICQIMLQTTASIEDDIKQKLPTSNTFLFIEVEDLKQIQQAMADEPLLIEERETFYGALETIVKDPYGNWVCFAQFVDR